MKTKALRIRCPSEFTFIPTSSSKSFLEARAARRAIACVLLSCCCCSSSLAATFRWAGSSNRIYVEGGGSATLTDIKTALPNAPLELVDAPNHVWLLRANLFVTDGCTLVLHGASTGGDVNELRLLSNNSNTTNSVVIVDADAATLDLNGTRVLSWDQAVSGPDTEYAVYGRAFIRARSRLVGTVNQESTLNVVNSDVGYLGFVDAESYGLTWQVVSSAAGVRVYGNVSGSHIHHCQLGVKTWSVDDVNWSGNEIAFNTLYGFDSADSGHQAVLANNNVHDNTYGATFRFSGASNRIYIEGGGRATLTDIKNALPSAPLDLVDSANKVWLLRANLQIEDGSVLLLHGSAMGGDVNEFRLLSQNSSNGFVNVTADYGAIDIQKVRITSWDPAVSGPDTEFATYGRAFIRVRSRLAADGVTPLESRMDIKNSDISYLGYDASESYGLSWKVTGTNSTPNGIFDAVNVYGDIIGNHIHDSFWGVYTYGLEGGQWLNNEIDHNAGYGFDPHDDSDHLLIEGNNVHHNGGLGRGTHGIIASRRCDHLVIRNNRSWANFENGIMIHRHSDDCVIENNTTYQNGDSGIALFDVDRAVVRNNVILSNANAGIRVTIGCADNVIANNEIGYSGANGLMMIPGSDAPEADPIDPTVTSRNRRNSVTNNFFHHSLDDAVKLTDGDGNLFAGNRFEQNVSTKLSFQTSTLTRFISNSLPADVTLRLIGSPAITNTILIKQEPLVNLSLADAFSATTFRDDGGAIFDFSPDLVATGVDGGGSSVTVTSTDVGGGSTVVTRNFTVRVESSAQQTIPPGGVLVRPTLWSTSGDLRKEWLTQSPAAAANLTYTVGDLAANTAYSLSRNGQVVASANSDSTGRATFADAPGTTSAVQYAVTPGGPPPPLPTVTVTATDANASEAGPDPGAFTVSRTGDMSLALTVHYSLGGTAVNGADYSSLSGSATIPAGSSSVTIAVNPIDDTAVEGSETVVLTLNADTAYSIGSPNEAAVSVADNDSPPPLPTVTVAATDANASEGGSGGPDPGTFAISRSGDMSAALVVYYSLGGSAANGSDYSTLSGSATIPAGSSSANVIVNPIDDTAVEGAETVVLTVSANAAYTVGSPNSATVSIADNDSPPPLPTVTVTVNDANASEAGPDPGTSSFHRTGTTEAALTVAYTLGGSAVNGTDYATLSGTVTIPAGSSSADVVVRPIDDAAVEGNETVVFNISANAAYTIGSPSSATITIADNDQAALPTVTVVASDANASESGPNPGTFSVSRSGDTSAALTVSYALGGSAANGSDYAQLSGSVTIPSGSSSANIVVNPIDDSAVEGNETVVLNISASSAYTVGSPNSATVTIADNDQSAFPTVTVVASDAYAAETGSDPGTFTVSRSGSTTASLTVTFSLGGTASNGSDYTQLASSVTIPSGSSSANVIVRPIDDAAVEGNETVILNISANSAYTIGSPNSATVTIADNDQASRPAVSVLASDAIGSESGRDPATFTISRNNASGNLVVKYTLSGTALNGIDYDALPGSVTIPSGQTSANVVVRPIDDSLLEVGEIVILTITPDPAYDVLLNLAFVTILDNDLIGGSSGILTISASTDSPNGPDFVTLQWNATVGETYQLQYTSAVSTDSSQTTATSGEWINLGSPIIATSTSVSTTDTIAPGVGRFYRVVRLP